MRNKIIGLGIVVGLLLLVPVAHMVLAGSENNGQPKVDVCHFGGHEGDVAVFDCDVAPGCTLIGDGSAVCITIACVAAENGHRVDTSSPAYVAACVAP